MKVKELIQKLRKLDPDAVVIFQDHDHGEDDVGGTVDNVSMSDSEVLQERFGGPVVVLN